MDHVKHDTSLVALILAVAPGVIVLVVTTTVTAQSPELVGVASRNAVDRIRRWMERKWAFVRLVGEGISRILFEESGYQTGVRGV